MTCHFSCSPLVSCIVFPAASEEDLELLFSTSDNYSIGKLFRTGLDCVFGKVEGEPEYDSNVVRADLFKIDLRESGKAPHEIKEDRHLQRRYADGSLCDKALVARQGHGNVGLNDWAIAYTARGTSTSPARLILPAGEVVHERIYPCFVKRAGSPRYSIEDLVFFAEPGANESVDIADVGHSKGADCTSVYLPVWHAALNGTRLRTIGRERRIDWSAGPQPLRLSKRTRESDGCLDATGLCIARVHDGELSLDTSNIEFAFFGIPVETLSDRRSRRFSRPRTPNSAALAQIVHYFYDLRHLLDLGKIDDLRREEGALEYYLFEHALKDETFKEARRCLADNDTVTVDLERLYTLCRDRPARAEVLDVLRAPKKGAVQNILAPRGYRYKADRSEVADAGHYALECDADDVVRKIVVKPLRAAYPYSFIGVIRAEPPGTEDAVQDWVVMAVSGGASGLRRGSLSSQGPIIFPPPMRFGHDLESAVEAVEGLLLKIFGSEIKLGGQNRLLLLDQGGDVHQWIGAGDLGTIIGGFTGRERISCELLLTSAGESTPDHEFAAFRRREKRIELNST